MIFNNDRSESSSLTKIVVLCSTAARTHPIKFLHGAQSRKQLAERGKHSEAFCVPNAVRVRE